MIVANHDGSQGALDWMETVQYEITDFDSDGKNSLLMHQLELAHWDEAQKCLDGVTDKDLLETPLLYHMVAITNLLKAVPDEFRHDASNQPPPINLKSFPLASNSAAVEARKVARRYFFSAAQIEQQLNCRRAAIIDDDYSLWLELRDSESFEQGKQRLEAKLNDPAAFLHYVQFALQFGIALDLALVEREIEKQSALYGSITEDAAIARFALAFKQNTPEKIVNYIGKYIDELTKYYNKKSLQSLQIEMLSKSGQHEKAREYLAILVIVGISKDEENELDRIIAEAEGVDPVKTRKEQFTKTELSI